MISKRPRIEEIISSLPPEKLAGLVDFVPDEIWERIMCKMDLQSMTRFAVTNKRFLNIYRGQQFQEECVAPKIGVQLPKELQKRYGVTLLNIEQNFYTGDNFYSLTVDGYIIDPYTQREFPLQILIYINLLENYEKLANSPSMRSLYQQWITELAELQGISYSDVETIFTYENFIRGMEYEKLFINVNVIIPPREYRPEEYSKTYFGAAVTALTEHATTIFRQQFNSIMQPFENGEWDLTVIYQYNRLDEIVQKPILKHTFDSPGNLLDWLLYNMVNEEEKEL